ncbi:MAG: hypothetical protein SFX18_00740 [Pirellulales bacterium]|nr:hypothetical protein [Pirellulales bacterium]
MISSDAVRAADSPASPDTANLAAPAATTLQKKPGIVPGKSSPGAASANVVDGYLVNGRWREGTRVMNLRGAFQMAGGERIQFQSHDKKIQLVVMENLMAERVGKTVQESEPLEWVVQGTITEYRGANYLLLQQATALTKFTAGQLESGTPPPANDPPPVEKANPAR